VVVVADAILETSRGSWRLDAPDEPFGDQQAEGVVHRLQRDGTDLGADDFCNAVGRDMGLGRNGPQDSQSLRRDLDAALTKEFGRISSHRRPA
jgi:hypothetical protein